MYTSTQEFLCSSCLGIRLISGWTDDVLIPLIHFARLGKGSPFDDLENWFGQAKPRTAIRPRWSSLFPNWQSICTCSWPLIFLKRRLVNHFLLHWRQEMYYPYMVLWTARVKFHSFSGCNLIADCWLSQWPHQNDSICFINTTPNWWPPPDTTWLSKITTLLTIYALIGDDMRLIFSEKAADDIFNVITATTMAVFGLEVIINTLGKQGYLGDESAGVRRSPQESAVRLLFCFPEKIVVRGSLKSHS